MALLFFVLAAFGLAYIVGHSRISLPFRLVLAGQPETHVRCPKCSKVSILSRMAQRVEPPGSRQDPSTFERYICGGCTETMCERSVAVFSVPDPRFISRQFFIELLECPACFGTWTGLAVGLLMPTLVPMDLPRALAGVALATFTAATNYLLARATGLTRAT